MTRDKIRLLVATGQIAECEIYSRSKGWRIRLTPKNQEVAETEGSIYLHAARGGIRHFKTVGAAVEAIRDLGIKECRLKTEDVLEES